MVNDKKLTRATMNKHEAALATIKAILEKTSEALENDEAAYLEDEDYDLQVLVNTLNTISSIVYACEWSWISHFALLGKR